jgi:Protein of unknown function (DUF3570)
MPRSPDGRSLGLRLCTIVFASSVAIASARAQEAAAAVYIRSDTDHTVVIAPRVRAQAPIADQTRITATYAADVWTSASVDIMASASKVPVTEQRDELDFSLDQEFEDVTLTAAYRFSNEPDYISHGGSGGFSYDFADNNSTIALGVSGSSDTVGRAGDPTFSRGTATLGGRLSFTQVLGTGTLAQVMYELSHVAGYQGSPYRFVPIGNDAECTSATKGQSGLSTLCTPEANPNERLRHAASIELRQALSEALSLGAAYRFYIDDWGILSHTVRADLAWKVGGDTILSPRYRFYLQNAANHYRSRYTEPQKYLTNDKELSPLSSHRVALELDRVWHFTVNSVFTTTLSAAVLLYSYDDFIPLDSITAFEMNVAMVFTL